ncbi:MAG: pirin family protein [Acidobacteriota bacterium]
MSVRPIRQLTQSQPTLEGAGVKLRRAFGFRNPEQFDPFLMLDDFRNDSPADFAAGFPWHPHRGIETITYVLAGDVQHQDSLGNSGVISAGDIQWMTSGRGILHQEMPRGDSLGRVHGFQLWANLPASLKMSEPRSQDVASHDVPVLTDADGVSARILCGRFWGRRGPVEGIAADPVFLDITLPPGAEKRLPVETDRNAFAYVFSGAASFRDSSAPNFEATNHSLIHFDRGDEVVARSGPEGARFLLVSGRPFAEPIAWAGPIVMNTQDELRQAFSELQNGTFLRA